MTEMMTSGGLPMVFPSLSLSFPSPSPLLPLSFPSHSPLIPLSFPSPFPPSRTVSSLFRGCSASFYHSVYVRVEAVGYVEFCVYKEASTAWVKRTITITSIYSSHILGSLLCVYTRYQVSSPATRSGEQV
jgi:hypothetical protein